MQTCRIIAALGFVAAAVSSEWTTDSRAADEPPAHGVVEIGGKKITSDFSFTLRQIGASARPILRVRAVHGEFSLSSIPRGSYLATQVVVGERPLACQDIVFIVDEPSRPAKLILPKFVDVGTVLVEDSEANPLDGVKFFRTDETQPTLPIYTIEEVDRFPVVGKTNASGSTELPLLAEGLSLWVYRLGLAGQTFVPEVYVRTRGPIRLSDGGQLSIGIESDTRPLSARLRINGANGSYRMIEWDRPAESIALVGVPIGRYGLEISTISSNGSEIWGSTATDVRTGVDSRVRIRRDEGAQQDLVPVTCEFFTEDERVTRSDLAALLATSSSMAGHLVRLGSLDITWARSSGGWRAKAKFIVSHSGRYYVALPAVQWATSIDARSAGQLDFVIPRTTHILISVKEQQRQLSDMFVAISRVADVECGNDVTTGAAGRGQRGADVAFPYLHEPVLASRRSGEARYEADVVPGCYRINATGLDSSLRSDGVQLQILDKSVQVEIEMHREK